MSNETSARETAHADCYFQIGHTHECCEDYALTGSFDGPEGSTTYALLGDGCSASEYVDFGARILVFAAKCALKSGYGNAPISQLGQHIIEHAATAARALNVQTQALDATLLLAFKNREQIRVCAWGDGVVVLRNKDSQKVAHLHYESGAPCYLSYLLDPQALETYRACKADPFTLTISEDGLLQSFELPFDKPFELTAPANQWSQLSLISDGLNTFKKPGEAYRHYLDILPEFVSYKNTSGVFVSRRMKFFEKYCLKEQLVHDDDISIATIVDTPAEPPET